MFHCVIPGPPVPQKQTRCCSQGSFFYDPSAKDKKRIQHILRLKDHGAPLKGPVELKIEFYMPIPKSASKADKERMASHKILHQKRPDEDNLAYLISNALKGIVYEDDSQVCAKIVYKIYDKEPRTVINVREIYEGYFPCD